jgi:multimeric flavodoxin WrbA/nitrite reductase/ring-hydroxylating ferredoxin subunit
MTPESPARWINLGPLATLNQHPLQEITIGRTRIALTFLDGAFSAVSGVCNHAGGPLGHGHLDGEFIVCPWHHWKFHCRTGEGEPGFEADRVPRYLLEERDAHLWIDLESATRRSKAPHEVHPLARAVERAPGALRVAGISTTNMDEAHPRVSTSDLLLNTALSHAATVGQTETRLIRLSALKFRACEGYYSKAAHACTWPCSITQMDPEDELDAVYEAIVHWADVILIATPIRWGNASALYYKMVERLNCVQNQITIRNRQLIRNKVAAMIITGGQDNVQAVAGQLLGFFAEIGFTFPPFPYIAHSRGWSAEDMEQNVAEVSNSEELRDGARALVDRAMLSAERLLATDSLTRLSRGGRKAHRLEVERPARAGQ